MNAINAPIAAAVRQMSRRRRLAILLVLVAVLDFSAPDGCDCGPNDVVSVRTR